jgi:hypothetical protein
LPQRHDAVFAARRAFPKQIAALASSALYRMQAAVGDGSVEALVTGSRRKFQNWNDFWTAARAKSNTSTR